MDEAAGNKCMVSCHPSSYNIMVFSWNTESVGLCETMDASVAAYNRTSCSSYISGATRWKYSCDIPDFYPRFSEFVVENYPDLVVIGFQEDRFPGSYFHSHLLPEEMPKIGYGLVKRTKLMGVGITTYKGIKNGDLFERGIRVSIYAKQKLIPMIIREEKEMRSVMNNDGQDEYVCSSFITRGKGATSSYIMLPGFGRLAFICCHLPFNARSLITERLYNNNMLRQNEINQSNICFNNIIENLVLFKEPIPTHIIYFGDFNYRLADPRPASQVATEFTNKFNDPSHIRDMYVQHDELKEQMRRKNIYEFYEGINNQGPTFVPTCKMEKKRTNYDPETLCGGFKLYKDTHYIVDNVPHRTLIYQNEKIDKNYFRQIKCQNNLLLDLEIMQPDIVNAPGDSPVDSDDEMCLERMFHAIPSSINLDQNVRTDIKAPSRGWKTGKQDQRVPSWCDRILYTKFGDDGHNLICTYYDRFDVGETMSKSDHAGVLSIFKLQ